MDKLEGFPGWERRYQPKEGEPHGWIQWKGTDACMDIHCVCGHHGHVDADFVYFIKCPKCERVYEVDQHIFLIEINKGEKTAIEPTVAN